MFRACKLLTAFVSFSFPILDHTIPVFVFHRASDINRRFVGYKGDVRIQSSFNMLHGSAIRPLLFRSERCVIVMPFMDLPVDTSQTTFSVFILNHL